MNEIEVLVSDFIRSREATPGMSPKSVVYYRMVLHRIFLPFVRERGLTRIEQVTRRLLVELAAWLQETVGRTGRPLSDATRNSYLTHINVFLNWIRDEVEEVAIPANAKARTAGLVPTKEPPLTKEEYEARLRAAPTERDKVILQVLWHTGMRAGELCSLRTSSLINDHRDRQLVRVTGKGGLTKFRQREVPLPEDGLLWKLTITAASRPRGVKTDHIFVSNRRRNGEYQPLGESGLTQLIDSIAKRAELPRARVFPHLFRHTAITRMLKRGDAPYVVSKVVGTSLQMIDKVYGHLVADDIYDLMRANLRRVASA